MTKNLIDITISTPDARFLCANISNFYFNATMDHYKYIQLPFEITPKKLSMDITSLALHKAAKYISIFKRACRVFHKMEEFYTIYLKINWRGANLNLKNSPQDSGPTNIYPNPSLSLLITLELSIPETNMQSISSKYFKNYKKSQYIGKRNFIPHSP